MNTLFVIFAQWILRSAVVHDMIIFRALDSELKNHGLSWENCLSFGADNASVMRENNTHTKTEKT